MHKRYPGNIARRGDGWRVRLCVAGKYHHFTVKGTRLDAENFAITKHAELSTNVALAKLGLPGPTRFSVLADEYVRLDVPNKAPGSIRGYEAVVAVSKDYFDKLGDPLVRDIRRSHIQTFLEQRALTPIRPVKPGEQPVLPSAHTVAKYFRVLRRLFSYGVAKDYLDSNPASHVRPPKADPRTPPILTSEQYETFLAKCEANPMLWLYILMLGETGMRAYSEALKLEWSDIDLTTGAITIRSTPVQRTKSGKSRTIPMTKRLHEAMKTHAAAYRFRSPFVFFHETTRRNAKAGEQIKTLSGSIKAAVKAAKLPEHFRLHDLRHRRVTTWLGESKSPALIQLAMGHSAIGVTLGYSHLTAQHLRALVEDDKKPEALSAATAATR
jgi:integrase/recombinase XerD